MPTKSVETLQAEAEVFRVALNLASELYDEACRAADESYKAIEEILALIQAEKGQVYEPPGGFWTTTKEGAIAVQLREEVSVLKRLFLRVDEELEEAILLQA